MSEPIVGQQLLGRYFYTHSSGEPGFVFSSSQDDGIYDRRFAFHTDKCDDVFQLGDMVSFVAQRRNGKMIARDVRSVILPEAGVIVGFEKRRASEFDTTVGQIQAADGRIIPFMLGGVFPDCIGRLRMPEGTAVRFRTVRRKGGVFAVDIENVSTEIAQIDPTTYVETGEIVDLKTSSTGHEFGFVQRPNGDSAYFSLTGIEDTLQCGAFVRYRPVRKPDSVPRFRCCLRNIEISAFAAGSIEEFFFNAAA